RRAAGLLPRARLLAPVLPEPVRLARHPRGRPRGRYGSSGRSRSRAAASRRRPARRDLRRQEGQGRHARPVARGAHRPRNGALGDAMGIDMKKEIKVSDLWKRGPKEPKAEKPPKEPKKAKEPKPPKEKKE